MATDTDFVALTRQVSFRLDDDTYRVLATAAKKAGQKMADYARDAVLDRLELEVGPRVLTNWRKERMWKLNR